MAWQQTTGYGQRDLVETVIDRYKLLTGLKLYACSLSNQQGELVLAVAMVNRMIQLPSLSPYVGPDPHGWTRTLLQFNNPYKKIHIMFNQFVILVCI